MRVIRYVAFIDVWCFVKDTLRRPALPVPVARVVGFHCGWGTEKTPHSKQFCVNFGYQTSPERQLMRTGTFSADDAARRQIPESRALCSTDDNRQYTVNDDVKQMTADSLADDVRLVRQTRSTV